MYSGYAQLEKLSPADYLDWQNFDTPWDKNNEYAEKQYCKGLEIGKEYTHVYICCNGTWGASKDNTQLSSYEGIGYHASTKELLHGFIDSGAEIIVYRYDTPAGIKIK